MSRAKLSAVASSESCNEALHQTQTQALTYTPVLFGISLLADHCSCTLPGVCSCTYKLVLFCSVLFCFSLCKDCSVTTHRHSTLAWLISNGTLLQLMSYMPSIASLQLQTATVQLNVRTHCHVSTTSHVDMVASQQVCSEAKQSFISHYATLIQL